MRFLFLKERNNLENLYFVNKGRVEGPEFGKTCLYNTCTLPNGNFWLYKLVWSQSNVRLQRISNYLTDEGTVVIYAFLPAGAYNHWYLLCVTSPLTLVLQYLPITSGNGSMQMIIPLLWRMQILIDYLIKFKQLHRIFQIGFIEMIWW